MQVGETFIKVRPDTRGFGGELQSGVQGQAATAGTGIGAEMGGAISRGLASVVAGGAAISFLSDAVTEASDLNEAVSLTGVTFEGAGQQILDMSETSAESMGLAKSEALNLATAIGGLFIGFGDSRAEAASMSEDVLQLGADLASAKNLTGGTTEALEILRSGLVGEVEPLRRIGVAFNAASVEQRALADTGKDSAASLTEGEKAAARYAIILESLTAQGVVGDFARTADGAANQQRILSAEWQNAQAELGQKLLPAYLDLVAALRDGIPLLGLVGESMAAGAEGASLLATAIGPLVGLVNDLDVSLGDASGGLESFAPGIGQLTQIVKQAQRIFANGLELGIGTVGGGDDPEAVFEDFVGGAENAHAAMELLSLDFGGDGILTIEEWAAAIRDHAIESGRGFREELAHLGISGAFASRVLGILGETGAATGAAMGDLGADARAAADDLSLGGLDEQAEALQAIADAADEARDKLEALYGIQQSLDDATVDLQAANDDLIASVLENGRTFNLATEEGRANYDAARASAEAIREQAVAFVANGGSARDAAAGNEFFIGTLRRQLIQSGLSAEETERLIDTYARVPRRILSQIEQEGGPRVREEASRVKGAIEAIPTSKRSNISQSGAEAVAQSIANLKRAIDSIPTTRHIQFSFGSDPLPPGLGPQGGQPRSRSALNKGGGGVHLHATGIGTPEQIAREVMPIIFRELERGGLR